MLLETAWLTYSWSSSLYILKILVSPRYLTYPLLITSVFLNAYHRNDRKATYLELARLPNRVTAASSLARMTVKGTDTTFERHEYWSMPVPIATLEAPDFILVLESKAAVLCLYTRSGTGNCTAEMQLLTNGSCRRDTGPKSASWALLGEGRHLSLLLY